VVKTKHISAKTTAVATGSPFCPIELTPFSGSLASFCQESVIVILHNCKFIR
jgi:hypothetical protein